jgi:hypothetical protein
MRWLLAAALLAAVACGQTVARPPSSPVAQLSSPASPSATASAGASSSPSTGPSPSPSPAASSKPPALLFAALEAKGTVAFQWNTVAIAGLDGYARAKTTFNPMPLPYVGCAGAVIPISAEVAAGKVYFSDAQGVVRSLSTTGQLKQVATFALTSTQQMLSFAVSPDGSRLMGAVFTLPPKPASGDPCSGSPAFAPGNFTLDVYSAQAGGSSGLLYHRVLATSGTQTLPNTMAFIGWDQVGPVGTSPTVWATQGGGPHHYSGVPVRIDSTTGKVLSQVASAQSDCQVWDMASSGDFLCAASGGPSVRRPDGTQIWAVSQSKADFYLAYLSPDEQRIAGFGTSSAVVARDGSVITLSGSFGPSGWLDSATMIGGGYNVNLNYVSLGSPGTVVDIGFKGMFIATVQG